MATAKKRKKNKITIKNRLGGEMSAVHTVEAIDTSPTIEARGHGVYVRLDNKAHYNITITPCAFYAARGWITLQQHDAAKRMHSLYRMGKLLPATGVASYDGMPSGSAGSDRLSVTDRMIYAKERYEAALRAVSGPVGKRIITAVVCDEIPAKELPSQEFVELAEYKAPPLIMARLREALTELSRHFGFE